MSKLKIAIPEEEIIIFCHKWMVRELALFGSALRQDFTSQSDLDILISFSEKAQWSLAEMVEMKAELQQIFCREIDLVEAEAIRNPFRRKEILGKKEVLYVA